MLQRMLELADVAGPLVLAHGLAGVLAQRLWIALQSASELAQEVLGYPDRGGAQRDGLDGGAFTQKPIRPEELVRKVRRVLDGEDEVPMSSRRGPEPASGEL
jgi:hypothetical protein